MKINYYFSRLLFIACSSALLFIMACSKEKEIPAEGLIEVEGGKVWYRINGAEIKPQS